MDFDDPIWVVASRLVETVDVLRDERMEPTLPFEIDDCGVTRVWLGGPDGSVEPMQPCRLPDLGICHVVANV